MYRDRIIRKAIQVAGFFAVNNSFHTGIYQGPLKRFCFPGLNCYACPLARFACPMGSFQHFISIREFPFYVLGFIGFVGILSGRLACGFLCPFGLVQDLLYRVRTYKIRLAKGFRYVKYGVLIGVAVVIVYITGETWFCKICPAGILGGGIPQLSLDPPLRQLVGWLFYMKYAILIFVVTASILIKRPFCRVICPLGAMWGFLNKITLLGLKVDEEKCDKCGICYKVCPMEIRISEEPASIDCIKCFQCKSACPQKAISITSGIYVST